MSAVFIITGANRGIGAVTAKLAASRGWRVVRTYRDQKRAADNVVEPVVQAGGAIAVQADTSVEADVVRVFDIAETRFGRMTGVVNNAAINGRSTTLADLSVEEPCL